MRTPLFYALTRAASSFLGTALRVAEPHIHELRICEARHSRGDASERLREVTTARYTRIAGNSARLREMDGSTDAAP